jgi:invasion protein IalB
VRVAALISAIIIAIGFAGVASAAEGPPLIVDTGWKKFCFNNQKTDFKRVCSTRAVSRKRDDQSLLAAVDVIDREGETKKIILRVTFPLGMQLARGTRLVVNGRDPHASPYTICTTAGCVSDHEATPGLLGRMQAGTLVVQATDASGKPLSVTLSLADFRAAYDGAAIETVVDEIEEPGWDIQMRPKTWQDDTLRPEVLQRTY